MAWENIEERLKNALTVTVSFPAGTRLPDRHLSIDDWLTSIAETDEELRELARKLGRRGGLKGGPARAAKMTKEERSESARKAARARWDKKRKEESS